jgi:putative nucleotidyltransferase with HDIG domain
MYVAKDIYAEDILIVPKDAQATKRMIAKLEMYGIRAIEAYTKEEQEQEQAQEKEPEAAEKPASMGSYLDSVKESADFQRFNHHYENVVSNLEGQFDSIIDSEGKIDTDKMLGEVDYLLDQSDNSYHMFDMLQCMRDYDDSTFTHCMNVSVISNMIARWLRFSEDDVATATLCGLLHDIGKLQIPERILNKPGKLTKEEFEIMKQHTTKGYALLKDRDLSLPIKLAALEHHEKCDGTGYPAGRKGAAIERFSKIVAIADVYDAMTAKRVYREALCPFEVIASFEREGIYKYETQYILKFLEEIANTYINNRVVLNDGTTGEIIYINRQDLSRPLIKTDSGFVDLSKKRELEIKALI